MYLLQQGVFLFNQMSTESNIIRTKRKDNFTIINNEIINAKMSLQALGLLVFLLSKPDDWKIQKRSLSKNFKNGRDATNTAFNELIDLGYIETVQVRQEGKFKSVNYLVYDQPEPQTGNQFTATKKAPQPEKPYTEKPYTEKPYTEKPRTENPSLLNTIDNKDGLNKDFSLNPNGLNEQSDSDRERNFELYQQEQNTFIAPQKSCAKKDPPKKSTHTLLMDLYWEWYKGLHDGIEPSITAADGQAMSHLRKFLEKQTTNKLQERLRAEPSPEEVQSETVKMLQYIFNNWGLLRNFEQSGLTIRQINSNITNIINQIKNGRQKSTEKAGSTAASIKQAFDNIDRAFGGN